MNSVSGWISLYLQNCHQPFGAIQIGNFYLLTKLPPLCTVEGRPLVNHRGLLCFDSFVPSVSIPYSFPLFLSRLSLARSPSHSGQYMHELDEKAPSLMCKAKKNSADLDSRKMTKSSFMQAHEFEKRRAESHSGIQPSVPLMISHTLSLISEQYEAAQALCALNQWQSSRATNPGSFNNSVAGQQAVLETVARVKSKKN
ncbi:uncharacterized protein LOC103959672 isoform X2 [Pyrus x bretschneideri]|uniref:uncharacterized protein LOC103959672 isoform X2 n=1 Tax=Pyrus x bretschneideri TaxID=225117 RepID=UPI00203096FE|nr:uncharacterized protein LOC103959672 isoform X2 [Pyrus x bretschneideri]